MGHVYYLIELLYILVYFLVNNPNFAQTNKAPYPEIKPTFCHPRKDPLTDRL